MHIKRKSQSGGLEVAVELQDTSASSTLIGTKVSPAPSIRYASGDDAAKGQADDRRLLALSAVAASKPYTLCSTVGVTG